MYQNMDRFL